MKRTPIIQAAACLFSAAFFFCAASCSAGRSVVPVQPQTSAAESVQTAPAAAFAAEDEDVALPESEETGTQPFPQTEASETATTVQTTVPAQTTTSAQTTTPVQTTKAATTSARAQSTVPTLTSPMLTTRPVVTGHIHSYHTTEQAPSCTEPGAVIKTCECGDKKIEYTAQALGHEFGAFVVTKEATYTEKGKKARTCARCGLQETEEIPKIRPYESMDAALEMLRLINAERAKVGSPALTFNNTCYPCAEIRAHEIITNYSHTRPNGQPFYTVIDENGLDRSGGCAENLYNPPGDSVPPEDGQKAFMESKAHRTNILNPIYKSASICVLYTEDRTYFVQLFFG